VIALLEYGPYYKKWKWLIWLIVVIFSVYIGFQYLLPLVLPFLVSLLLARLVSPMVKSLHKKWNIPIKLGAPIVMLLVMAIFLILLSCFGLSLFKQIKGVLTNFPIYQNRIVDYFEDICRTCDDMFHLGDGASLKFVNDNMNNLTNMVVDKVIPTMTQKTITAFVWTLGAVAVFIIIFISALLILEDMDEWKDKYQGSKAYPYLHPILNNLGSAGKAYLRAQIIILGSIAVSCAIGLWLIGNPYFLLIGILIALLDALPIIGSGMILIPWAIIQAISGNFYQASVLISLYAVCLAIREILEPKLIGNRIGVKPIFILMASFVGIKLFGLAGIILGPIALVTIKVCLESMGYEYF
jgi:sporulation integral membrane protein YtvI